MGVQYRLWGGADVTVICHGEKETATLYRGLLEQPMLAFNNKN